MLKMRCGSNLIAGVGREKIDHSRSHSQSRTLSATGKSKRWGSLVGPFDLVGLVDISCIDP